jgi:hypothetical protein
VTAWELCGRFCVLLIGPNRWKGPSYEMSISFTWNARLLKFNVIVIVWVKKNRMLTSIFRHSYCVRKISHYSICLNTLSINNLPQAGWLECRQAMWKWVSGFVALRNLQKYTTHKAVTMVNAITLYCTLLMQCSRGVLYLNRQVILNDFDHPSLRIDGKCRDTTQHQSWMILNELCSSSWEYSQISTT